MIRFTVIWGNEAQDELSTLWMNAEDRQAIADAANSIDRQLAYDAESQGEDIAEGLRRITVPPLAALFDVETEDRKVSVSAIRLAT